MWWFLKYFCDTSFVSKWPVMKSNKPKDKWVLTYYGKKITRKSIRKDIDEALNRILNDNEAINEAINRMLRNS